MFSFKNPLHAWIVIIIIIVIIVIWPPRPWPPPCLVCGEFLKDFSLPIVFVALAAVGISQNLPRSGGGLK